MAHCDHQSGLLTVGDCTFRYKGGGPVDNAIAILSVKQQSKEDHLRVITLRAGRLPIHEARHPSTLETTPRAQSHRGDASWLLPWSSIPCTTTPDLLGGYIVRDLGRRGVRLAVSLQTQGGPNNIPRSRVAWIAIISLCFNAPPNVELQPGDAARVHSRQRSMPFCAGLQ